LVLLSSLFIPRGPPTAHPFPYTTLFRSIAAGRAVRLDRARRADVVGGDRVAEHREQAGALNVCHRRWRHRHALEIGRVLDIGGPDRKSTRLNSSHVKISYAVFCYKKQTH